MKIRGIKMKREYYDKKLQRYKEIVKTGESIDEDEELDLECELLEHNSFENFLNREIAEKIIENHQQLSLDSEGGWPLWDEEFFEVDGQKYSVIAWGASGCNEGKDALQGIVFVREDDENFVKI